MACTSIRPAVFLRPLLALVSLGAALGAQTLGSELRVDTDLPGVASSALPRIVGTADDALHVVWQDYRNPEWAVYYRRLEAFGQSTPFAEQPLSILVAPPTPAPNATSPTIATDGVSHLYVAWHALYNGQETIFFVRSPNGGLNWTPPTPLVDTSTGVGVVSEFAGPPIVAADALGHVYVAWSQSDGVRDQIYFARSDDFGVSFELPPIGQPVNPVTNGHSEQPALAHDGLGHVYIAYLDHREQPYRDVYLRRSTDWGGSWEPGETRMNAHGVEIELNLVAHADLDQGLQRRVMAAWIELEDDANGNAVTFIRSRYSADGGQSFQALEHPVDTGPIGDPNPSSGPAGGPLQGPKNPASPAPGGGTTTDTRLGTTSHEVSVSIAFDLDLEVDAAGDVHALYSRIDLPFVGQPMTVHHNRLDGSTGAWGKERKISRGGSPYPVHHLPTFARADLATDGATLFATWMGAASGVDGGVDERAEVYAALSTDGGTSWTKPVVVPADPAGPGLARKGHPRLFARDGRAALVWDDRRNWTDHTSLPLPPDVPVGAPDLYLNVISP